MRRDKDDKHSKSDKNVIIPNNDPNIALIQPFGNGNEYVRSPIIAWSINNPRDHDDHYPQPITFESLCGEWFIELPERYGIRRYVYPEEMYFDTLEEALDEYRRRAEQKSR